MNAMAFEAVPAPKTTSGPKTEHGPKTTNVEDIGLLKTSPSMAAPSPALGSKWFVDPSLPSPEPNEKDEPVSHERIVEQRSTRELTAAEQEAVAQMKRVVDLVEQVAPKVEARIAQPTRAGDPPITRQQRQTISDRWRSIKIVLAAALTTMATAGVGVAAFENSGTRRRTEQDPTAITAFESLREKIVGANADKPAPPVSKPEFVAYEVQRAGTEIADTIVSMEDARITPNYVQELIGTQVDELYRKRGVDGSQNQKVLRGQVEARVLQELYEYQDLALQRKERLLDIVQAGQKDFTVSYAFLAAVHAGNDEVIALLMDAYENNPRHNASLSQDRLAQRFRGQQDISNGLLGALDNQPNLKTDLIGGLIRQRDAVNAHNLRLHEAQQQVTPGSWTDAQFAIASQQLEQGTAEYRRISYLLNLLIPHTPGSELLPVPQRRHHEHRNQHEGQPHHRHHNRT